MTTPYEQMNLETALDRMRHIVNPKLYGMTTSCPSRRCRIVNMKGLCDYSHPENNQMDSLCMYDPLPDHMTS
jgi:hypothetical protein